MSGTDQLPILIAEKGQSLIQQLIPPIVQIAEKAGIKYIGELNMEMPNSCLVTDELKKILQLRNNMINFLNSTVKTIELLSKPVDILNTAANASSIILSIAKTTRISANTALSFVPVTPGAAPASINNLKDLIDKLDIRVQITKIATSTILGALDYVNEILFKLLNLLKTIDNYLTGCGVTSSDLIPINDYLNTVEQQYTQAQESLTDSQVYNGFTLGIVEEQFSPTVKRIKGVARNPQGIILLQTPLSFTTSPQILIAELKLIIDKSNLKAY